MSTGAVSGSEWRSHLPLSYEDGEDYCTVTDKDGNSFALTVQPELLKAIEEAATSCHSQELPVAYQQLKDGKWVQCSEFVAKGWGSEISEGCRALYLHPQSPAEAELERAHKALDKWNVNRADYIGDTPDSVDDRIDSLVEDLQAARAHVEGVRAAAQFLLDRLEEFDPGEDDAENEYNGHVTPAIARLKTALAPQDQQHG